VHHLWVGVYCLLSLLWLGLGVGLTFGAWVGRVTPAAAGFGAASGSVFGAGASMQIGMAVASAPSLDVTALAAASSSKFGGFGVAPLTGSGVLSPVLICFLLPVSPCTSFGSCVRCG